MRALLLHASLGQCTGFIIQSGVLSGSEFSATSISVAASTFAGASQGQGMFKQRNEPLRDEEA
jgi:hypothetical protein